jgi:hypothetical protein
VASSTQTSAHQSDTTGLLPSDESSLMDVGARIVALLVAATGAPPLLAAGLLAALVVAVAVSAITVRPDEENRVAALTKANPLPQNRFAMNHRHASSQAGLDKLPTDALARRRSR